MTRDCRSSGLWDEGFTLDYISGALNSHPDDIASLMGLTGEWNRDRKKEHIVPATKEPTELDNLSREPDAAKLLRAIVDGTVGNSHPDDLKGVSTKSLEEATRGLQAAGLITGDAPFYAKPTGLGRAVYGQLVRHGRGCECERCVEL